MELDEMQRLWQSREAATDAAVRASALLVRHAVRQGTRTTIGHLTRVLRAEIACDALALFAIASNAARDVRDGPVLAASIVLGAYAVAILAAAIAQLVLLARIDYRAPLVAIAKTFGEMRLLRARTVFSTLAFAPLMWVPLSLIVARAFAGVAVTSVPWLVTNAAFGVAMLAIALFLARRFGFDALSGRSVRIAADDLADARRFAEE